MTMKNDQYRKARGGKAFMVHVHCAKCGKQLLYYQKDGDGPLKRCYLNRIFGPAELEKLQRDVGCLNPSKVPPLVCAGCDTVIGKAISHHDGRVAFRLRPGYIFKKRDTRATKEK